MGRKKAKSPAQQARAKYMEAHGLRANSNANIWFTRCPRSGADLVLIGDARIEHFYATEGDPDVAEAVYGLEPMTVAINGQAVPVKFDAKVEFLDGRVEYRIVGKTAPHNEGKNCERQLQACISAAEGLGGVYRPVLLRDLDACKQRILNWRRAMRFWRACKHHSLAEPEAAVYVQLVQHKRLTIAQLLQSLPGFEPPIVVGAITRLLHKRALVADLDTQMLSAHTLLQLKSES